MDIIELFAQDVNWTDIQSQYGSLPGEPDQCEMSSVTEHRKLPSLPLKEIFPPLYAYSSANSKVLMSREAMTRQSEEYRRKRRARRQGNEREMDYHSLVMSYF